LSTQPHTPPRYIIEIPAGSDLWNAWQLLTAQLAYAGYSPEDVLRELMIIARSQKEK